MTAGRITTATGPFDPKKFPQGDADMKALVDRIHEEGFKAQLWWSPLSAVPDSQLLKEHPDFLLLNEDGSKRKISWWNSFYLCPADREVVEYHKALVRKILGEWGFDGLKLDGQHMNGVPACYNPAHHHKRPEDSVEALPDFFREIYETARSVKPDALVEFCPCGTAYSFFTMPHFNMSVASDPESSFQIRSKGKTLKALMGDNVPYFGDHVELSDGAIDFASTVGRGWSGGYAVRAAESGQKARHVGPYAGAARKYSRNGSTSTKRKCFPAASILEIFTTSALIVPRHTSFAKAEKCTMHSSLVTGADRLNCGVCRIGHTALWIM